MPTSDTVARIGNFIVKHVVSYDCSEFETESWIYIMDSVSKKEISIHEGDEGYISLIPLIMDFEDEEDVLEYPEGARDFEDKVRTILERK